MVNDSHSRELGGSLVATTLARRGSSNLVEFVVKLCTEVCRALTLLFAVLYKLMLNEIFLKFSSS